MTLFRVSTNCVEFRCYLVHVVTHLISDDFLSFPCVKNQDEEFDCGGCEILLTSSLNCGLVFQKVFFPFTKLSVVCGCRRRRKANSADLYHSGHLPYQLLKTVYKLPSPKRKQKSIWLFIDIRCCETKKADRKNICKGEICC